MADGLVTLTIDGAPVSVPPGTLVIEAAKQAGVLVPHYCYHPGLAVAGVCRMCLVEIEKAPKLQIACATTVTEGMVVKTQTAPAKDARQSVLEFLLINHPLDCPICDQAGECELQDFVFQEGRSATRYGEYAKRFNPVEDFGPDVLYVPNRCILCTRCVRFMDDVAQEPVLNVSERGDRAYIGIHPEAPLAGVPNLALRAERAPNAKGAEQLGYTRDYDAAVKAAESAAVVLVLDDPDCPVQTAGALIYAGTVLPPETACRAAQVVLPIANVAEEEGTFVNRDGRAQRYFQAKPAPGMARPAAWVLGELA